MNSSSYFPEQNTISVKPNWQKWVWGSTAALLLIVVITIISLLMSPIGRRWQANQTAQPAVIGSTEIDVIGDAELNHVFAPAVTQVQVDTKVTWHFKEIDEDGYPVPHNVVFDDLESPVLAEGTFSRTFDTPGTYQYVCTLHPYMEGVVEVVE